MHYLVIAMDKADMLARRLELRPAHVAYWQGLAPSVAVAGAVLESDLDEAGAVGSAFVIEAVSEEEVRRMIAADPFTVEGVFAEEVVVHRIRPAIGSWLG